MKTLLTVLGGISLTLALSLTARAKEWRGIVPLHTTRAGVVALLGEPNAEYGRYDFEDETADIFYAAHTCSEGGAWNVPFDTVTSISVYPKGKLKLSDLQINLKEYEKYVGPHRTSYYNKREGIRYETIEPSGEVMEIYYEPAATDENLRCPNPTPTPTCKNNYDVCPMAWIKEGTETCTGSVRKLVATVGGLDPNDKLTFNWTVSDGEITDGQGTSAVTIDTASAGGKPVTAKLKVELSLCEACNIEESYVIEPCPKKKVTTARRRKP